MVKTISASVGKGGKNRPADVLTVQRLLNPFAGKVGFRRLKEDSLNGPNTMGAIAKFQKKIVGMQWPDSRVDPGHKTIQALNRGPQKAPGGGGAGAKPFDVSFQTDPIPTSVDHSQSNPGPVTGSVRAGHTAMKLDAKLSIDWSDAPAQPSQQFPFYVKTAKITFFLKNFKISISSDYPKTSCPYKVTYEHELKDHLQPSIKLFHSCKDAVIKEVNKISVPTQASPKQLTRAEAAMLQQKIEKSVVDAIKKMKAEIDRKLKAHQRSVDTPAKYRAIYAKCPAADW